MSEVKKTEQKQQERPQGAMLHSSSSASFSSRCQDQSPETCRATTVGCMSGIFRLFSHHHSSRRKLLAFGKKDGTCRSRTIKTESKQQSGSAENDKRISVESPRSMTLPQETLRRSSSAATEKRMMLLGALAKCDEDLRELKKIIEELKSDSLAVEKNYAVEAELMPKIANDGLIESSSGEQPSPVSVLDELTRSPPFSRCAVRTSSQYGTRMLEHSSVAQCNSTLMLDCLNIKQQQQQIKRRHEEFLGSQHLKSIQRAAQHGGKCLGSSPLWCSSAMVETVEKACSEIAWGENRERGRIGMALQEQIYRDLIEETVTEVMEIGKLSQALHLKLYYTYGKLHGRGCRRRLSY